MMEIDTADPRLGIAGMPFSRLPLYYCFTCRLGLDHFYYRINADNSITSITTRFTGEGDPFHMTKRWPNESGARLQPLTAEEQAFLSGGYTDMPLSWSIHEEPPPFHYLYGHNDQTAAYRSLTVTGKSTNSSAHCASRTCPFLHPSLLLHLMVPHFAERRMTFRSYTHSAQLARLWGRFIRALCNRKDRPI